MKNPWFWSCFITVMLLAAFLRLYGLEEFITFLGDQGRDAIVMKRLITFEDLPGIGPRSSIGQVFLGPLYYYMMAPFLLLTGFSPVGPAFGVAFISLVALGYFGWRLEKEYGKKIALLFMGLIAVSYVNIWLTRFSWNPNLLPVFSFATVWFAHRMIRHKRLHDGIAFGFFLGASLQLHYLTLLILPAIFGYLAVALWHDRKHLKRHMKQLGAAALTFVVVFAPLIVFDLKNNFLNLRGLIGIFTEKQFQSQSTYLDRMLDVQNNFLSNLFQIQVHYSWGWILLPTIAAIGYLALRQKKTVIMLHAAVLLSFICAFALVDTQRYMHYFTPVYYSIFLLLAWAIGSIRHRTAAIGIGVVFLSGYAILNAQQYWFFQEKGNFQTRIAEKLADAVISTDVKAPYHMVSIPITSTNDHIRYYLELKNVRPLPVESLEKGENLVIMCWETGKDACNVMNDAQYQVVMFGDRKVEREIKHPEGVRIFKLIHAK